MVQNLLILSIVKKIHIDFCFYMYILILIPIINTFVRVLWKYIDNYNWITFVVSQVETILGFPTLVKVPMLENKWNLIKEISRIPRLTVQCGNSVYKRAIYAMFSTQWCWKTLKISAKFSTVVLQSSTIRLIPESLFKFFRNIRITKYERTIRISKVHEFRQ